MKYRGGRLLFVAGISIVFFFVKGGAAEPVSGENNLNLFDGKHSLAFLPGIEFPGASGDIRCEKVDETPVGRLTYDFSKGGNYVAVSAEVSIPAGYSELRLSVKSSEAQTVLVRLVDSTGEVLQYELPYSNAGEWQDMRIVVGSNPAIHFRGNNNGVWDFPIGTLMLGVTHKEAGAPAGELVIRNVVLMK